MISSSIFSTTWLFVENIIPLKNNGYYKSNVSFSWMMFDDASWYHSHLLVERASYFHGPVIYYTIIGYPMTWPINQPPLHGAQWPQQGRPMVNHWIFADFYWCQGRCDLWFRRVQSCQVRILVTTSPRRSKSMRRCSPQIMSSKTKKGIMRFGIGLMRFTMSVHLQVFVQTSGCVPEKNAATSWMGQGVKEKELAAPLSSMIGTTFISSTRTTRSETSQPNHVLNRK